MVNSTPASIGFTINGIAPRPNNVVVHFCTGDGNRVVLQSGIMTEMDILLLAKKIKRESAEAIDGDSRHDHGGKSLPDESIGSG
jgi:hypothetical protein